MQTVQRAVFITQDGKEFTDETRAREYEAELQNEVEIDEFVASLENASERARSRMRNDILKFLAFRQAREEAEAMEEITSEASEEVEQAA